MTVLLGAVVVLTSAPALPHDLVLTERQSQALQDLALLAGNTKSPDGLNQESVDRVRRDLATFTTHDREDLPNCELFRTLPTKGQAVLRRWIDADAWMDSLAQVVQSPWGTACRMASTAPSDISGAILDLASAPFGAQWERVLVRASADGRPQVRLGAGVLAKVGTLFDGPKEPYERIAQNLITDRDPNVAAKFGMAHVYDFHSRRLIDLLCARTKDTRTLSSAEGVLRSAGPTVGESVVVGLRQNLFSWRSRYHDQELPRDKVQTWVAEDVTGWWAQNGKVWRFGPTQAKWKPLIDHVVTARVGESLRVDGVGGVVTVRIEECRFWSDEQDWPRYTLAAECVDASGDIELRMGNPDHEFGWVAKASAERVLAEAIAIPAPGNAVRVRVWLWQRTEE